MECCFVVVCVIAGILFALGEGLVVTVDDGVVPEDLMMTKINNGKRMLKQTISPIISFLFTHH